MGDRLESVDAVVEKYAVVSNPVKSRIYVGLGSIFVVFSIIGIWIPGWPTVSWAVPAAFLFSLSNEKLFRWTLTNRFFGSALFEYYATGKTLPGHVKLVITAMIGLMSSASAYFVWYISTRGDGTLFDTSSWNGKDEFGFGAITVLSVGILGMIYVLTAVKTRTTTLLIKHNIAFFIIYLDHLTPNPPFSYNFQLDVYQRLWNLVGYCRISILQALGQQAASRRGFFPSKNSIPENFKHV